MRDPAPEPSRDTGDVTGRLDGLGAVVRERVAVPAYEELATRAVRRRRRRQGALAAAAVLVVAAGAVGVLHRADPGRSSTATVPHRSPTPATSAPVASGPTPTASSAEPSPTSPSDSPSPSASTGAASGTATEPAGSGVLPAPDAPIFGLQYDGTQRAVAAWRSCPHGQPCQMVVGYTEDGWSSARTLAPPEAGPDGWMWTQLLPGHGAAVVVQGGHGFVLTSSGSGPLTVSTQPAAPGPGSLLVGAPPLPPDVSPNDAANLTDQVWVLDPATESLHPLATQPAGPHGETVISPSTTTVGDSTYVLLGRPPQGPGERLRVAVARTLDRGLTWSVSPVPTPGAATTMPGYLAVGPNGRVAVLLSADGATLSPFVELWTSTDSGRTWRRVPAAHHPDYVGGMAYAPDGMLTVAASDKARLWRLTADGSDLKPVPGAPAISGFWDSARPLVGDLGDGKVALSDDGRTWREVAPAQRLHH